MKCLLRGFSMSEIPTQMTKFPCPKCGTQLPKEEGILNNQIIQKAWHCLKCDIRYKIIGTSFAAIESDVKKKALQP